MYKTLSDNPNPGDALAVLGGAVLEEVLLSLLSLLSLLLSS